MRKKYPNYHIFWKNRKIKIDKCNGLCEICGAMGKHMHHKDFKTDNHSLSNLIFLCIQCHKDIHNKNNYFYKKYGMFSREYAALYNLNQDYIGKLSRENKLIKDNC